MKTKCNPKKVKCKHEWEYFDTWEHPNGYEYEHVCIPHRKCKKCGREYELFDNYGDCKNRNYLGINTDMIATQTILTAICLYSLSANAVDTVLVVGAKKTKRKDNGYCSTGRNVV